MKNKIGDLRTCFFNAASERQEIAGDEIAITNGYPLAGGDKGTPGQIPEVTMVSVHGGPAPDDHVTVGDSVARPRGSGMGQV